MRLIFLLITALLLGPTVSLTAETVDREFGLRGGIDSNHEHEHYTAAEVYLLQDLPWRITPGGDLVLKTRFDAGATYLDTDSDKGALLALGGELVLVVNDGLEFEVGFRPTWMPDHEFGQDDFGGALQFSSHIGLAADWQDMVFSYRLQHTSNAGIYSKNPGMNLHMFGLGYRF